MWIKCGPDSLHTCTIYNSENAKVNEEIAGASHDYSASDDALANINYGPLTYYIHVKSTVASDKIAMCS